MVRSDTEKRGAGAATARSGCFPSLAWRELGQSSIGSKFRSSTQLAVCVAILLPTSTDVR